MAADKLSSPPSIPSLHDAFIEAGIRRDHHVHPIVGDYERLKYVFRRLDSKGDHVIDVDELSGALRALGANYGKAEVKDMIWEVDEKGDGVIDWSEFQLMYERVRHDRTGVEPRKLWRAVEFMMSDKSDTGEIGVSEVIGLLTDRYGCELIPSQLREAFQKEGFDGERLTFAAYMQVTRHHVYDFRKMSLDKPANIQKITTYSARTTPWRAPERNAVRQSVIDLFGQYKRRQSRWTSRPAITSPSTPVQMPGSRSARLSSTSSAF